MSVTKEYIDPIYEERNDIGKVLTKLLQIRTITENSDDPEKILIRDYAQDAISIVTEMIWNNSFKYLYNNGTKY
jgi:hypothetical protein